MEKGMPLVRIQGAYLNAGAIVHGEWERCIRLLRLNPLRRFQARVLWKRFPHQFRQDFRLEQRLEVFHTVHTALSGPHNVPFCVYIMDM